MYFEVYNDLGGIAMRYEEKNMVLDDLVIRFNNSLVLYEEGGWIKKWESYSSIELTQLVCIL